MALREDSHFLLTTILWGNVSINVLLTLLSDSVMAGLSAFLFSTFAITFFGEITPQAYFSRNAIRMGALMAPLIRFYQFLLFPVAKPSAWVLDKWLGREGIQYFREHNLRTLINKHIQADNSEIDRIEGLGALNFLALDDLLTTQEGEPIDQRSIIQLPFQQDAPVFPPHNRNPDDPFLRQVNASGKKWVVIVDAIETPCFVLNTNAFLRHACLSSEPVDPMAYCHKPIVVADDDSLLGGLLSRLKVGGKGVHDDVIDQDIILLWSQRRRIITGSDILGRLLRGISTK